MISNNLDAAAGRFLAGLRRTEETMGRAQRQISSGYRISSASDAPDDISAVLSLKTQIARNDQVRASLDRAKTETDTAENALESAVAIMERAGVLGMQGGSGTMTAAGRAAVITELDSLMERILSISQTSVNGRFLFSGDSDQAAAYAPDPTSPTGVSRQFQVDSTRLIEHPGGSAFIASKTAQDIFDARDPADDATLAPENVFRALKSLRDALSTEPPDHATVQASLDLVHAAGDHLNNELAFYGNTQNRIQEAMDFGSRLDTRLRAELAARQETDVPTAALELSQAQLSREASLAARAQLPRRSLFDYLG